MKQRYYVLIPALALVLAGCGEHEHSGEEGHDSGSHAEAQHSEGDGHGHEEAGGDQQHDASGKQDDDHSGEGHESQGKGNEKDASEHEGEGNHLALSDEVIREFNLEIREAAPGSIALTRDFPGEIVFDEGLITHVTARVPGRAEQILKESGERVEKGDVLAVLSSRELARVRSDYLAAKARLELAQATFERKRRLAEDQVASEAELQEARQALSDAQVQVELGRRELQTLGMTQKTINALNLDTNDSLARYELTAPTDGTLIERHLTRGERVDAGSGDSPFVIASREQVWAELSIFPQSIDDVATGQSVMVQADDSKASASSPITYITPLMHEATRAAQARVVLENASGQWYPGQFVTASVTVERVEADVVVPATAIQTMNGQSTVFVRTDDGFEARPVRTGPESKGRVAIQEGLKAGERYAAVNTFTLKAEFGRDKLESAGHSH